MINFKEVYFTVWEMEDKGNYLKTKLSSSKKDKKTDKYVNSNWFASFVGEANTKGKGLNKGDRIKANGGVSCEKYEDKYPTRVVVFDFEILESKPKNDIPEGFTQIEDDSLPF